MESVIFFTVHKIAELVQLENLCPLASMCIQLVKLLPSPYEEYELYTDNFLTSKPLVDAMKGMKVQFIGIVRQQRLQAHLKDRNLPELGLNKISCHFLNNNEEDEQKAGQRDYLVCSQDRSLVHFFTYTHYAPEEFLESLRRRGRSIPRVAKDYNNFIGGVDIADQYQRYMTTARKERQCWLPLFHWLQDVTLVNAWVRYSVETDCSSQ